MCLKIMLWLPIADSVCYDQEHLKGLDCLFGGRYLYFMDSVSHALNFVLSTLFLG